MAIAIDPNTSSDYYIWEPRFRCSIPQLQTTSPTHMRLFGTHTTGDPDTDRVLANQDIVTFLTIADMVKHYKNGVPIKVLKYDDTKTIYEYIEHHIHCWKKRLETGINIGNAPIEDLITMDAFASTVYQHARHLINEDEINSFLIKAMGSVQKFNKFNLVKPLSVTNDITTINGDDEPEFSQRQSLADVFKNTKVGFRKWK